MAIGRPAGLDDGNGRQVPGCYILVKVLGVLEVRRALGGVGHDFGFVVEGVADVAVGVERAAGIGDVCIPAVAVVFPGNVFRRQCVANALDGGSGERKRIRGRKRRRTVAVEAGVVVVEDVVVSGFTVGFNRACQRSQIIHDGSNAGLAEVGAVHVAAAASATRSSVAVVVIPVVGAGLRVRIFDLIGRWGQRFAFAIAVPDGIGEAELNVIGHGAAHHGLMEVVAQGVLPGQ